MNKISEKDIKLMRRCFTLAKRGAGKVNPNPLVGAVIVKNGKVISEGWHRQYGKSHAEVNAIQNAKTDVQGSTLYVNLEPCCHTKKQTPPCTPLIISKRFKKIVISNFDPNPDVSGKGIALLKAAGLDVITGVLEEKGQELNRFFFKYMDTALPFVVLKAGITLDGKITKNKNQRSFITGEKSNKFVHIMRSQYDAVMVGANTVKVDNPSLTVRHVVARNPNRIIIDGNLSVPINADLFRLKDGSSTIIYTGKNSNPEKIARLEDKGIEIIKLPVDQNGYIDLELILKSLGKRKITSLIIEGGQSIFSQFISKKLFDQIVLLQAPKIFGRGLDAFDSELLEGMDVYSVSQIGGDIKIILDRKKQSKMDEMKHLNL